MKIYEILEKLKTERPHPLLGICANFDTAYELANSTYLPEQWLADSDLVSDAMEQWPGYSGESLFPVPDPSGKFGPCEAYSIHSGADTMWSSSEYAHLRIHLLVFLINHFRELDQ